MRQRGNAATRQRRKRRRRRAPRFETGGGRTRFPGCLNMPRRRAVRILWGVRSKSHRSSHWSSEVTPAAQPPPDRVPHFLPALFRIFVV